MRYHYTIYYFYYTHFAETRKIFLQFSCLYGAAEKKPPAAQSAMLRTLCALCQKWRDSYINYGEKPLARGEVLLYTLYKTAVKTHHLTQPPGPYYYIWEGNRVPNGIYIQTEYHGKLIRKIVCNGDERWFIGSNCAVTFMSMDDCMAAIDRL